MVSSINTIMYNLNLLNQKNAKVTYGLTSNEALQYGSDDTEKYNQILSINNNVNTYNSIYDRIKLTNSFNTTSDSIVSNIKDSVESTKALLLKASTATTTSEGKASIASEIESLKNSIYNLANSNVENQYLFAGKNTSNVPFTKDATGKISYVSTNDNKTVNVDKSIYVTQGINGLELLYHTNATAQNGSSLTFSQNELIYDGNGNQYNLLDSNSDGSYDILSNSDGTTTMPVTSNSDGTYTVTNSTSSTLESKHSIFDDFDEVINALNQKDSNGNTITSDKADTILSNSISKIDSNYNAVNLAHSNLGIRTASIENYKSIIQTKVTNFEVLQQTAGAADYTALAVQSQALQNTYTALYSTINKVSSLSLVKYLS